MRCASTAGLSTTFWQHNHAATLSRQFHNISLVKRAGISSLFKDSFKLNRPSSYVVGYGRFLRPAADLSPCKALHRLWQNHKRTIVTQSTNFSWNNSPTITLSGFRESGLRSFARLPPLQDVEHDLPYVDFDVSPQFTIPDRSELTEEVVSTIEQDLNRYVEHIKAVVRDIKNVSDLGELPVSIENGSVRIHFPNCDTEKVHRLISDVDVTRGVVSDEGSFTSDIAVAGTFSSDGDSSFTQISGSSSDLYVESLNSEDIPTPSLTRDTQLIQEDSGEGISSRVKKRARTSKVSYAGMDGSTAEEDADDSSILVAHQEEEFGEDNQPRIEEDGQWTLDDADKVIGSVANAEEISSSYHDMNESVLGKRKGVGIGVGGQRKSPRRRFRKDDIPYIHDVDNNVRTSRRSIFENESATKRQKVGINAVSVMDLKLLGSDVKVPNTVLEALKSSYADFWRDAMQAEMDSQLGKKVFEPVDRSEVNKDATVVDTRWVFAVKTDSEGYVNRFKARLVARGFTQVEDKDYGDVYAPVVGVEDVRILCALAAIKNMKMKSFDVTTAFLNAPIDREIFIKMPKGTKDYDESGKPQLYQVLRALYGLRQAPKQWYDMFMSTLEDIGFQPLVNSSNILVKGSGESQVIVAVYVDDTMIMSQNLDAMDRVLEQIQERFETDKPDDIGKFLGMDIKQSSNGSVTITAVEYIEKTAKRLDLEGLPLKNVPMPTTIQLDTPKEEDSRPLNPEEHYRYRSLVGSLRYLTTILRVDLGNPVRRLSHYLQSPLLHHQKLAFHVFGYVLNTKHYGLAFKVTSDNEKSQQVILMPVSLLLMKAIVQ
jgi:hypothetical protein